MTQSKYLSIKYFVQLSVCMAVYILSQHLYLFCILYMHELYMYICRSLLSIAGTGVLSRCTDMFYNCVVFVIANKRTNCTCKKQTNKKPKPTCVTETNLFFKMKGNNSWNYSHSHLILSHAMLKISNINECRPWH